MVEGVGFSKSIMISYSLTISSLRRGRHINADLLWDLDGDLSYRSHSGHFLLLGISKALSCDLGECRKASRSNMSIVTNAVVTPSPAPRTIPERSV